MARQVLTTLTLRELQDCIQASVPSFSARWLNADQEQAVAAPPSPPVFIVAGPGSGKTTVLALRVLKHIFVDGFPPDGIMATTFTRKAAKELRSRILGWGVLVHGEVSRRARQAADAGRVAWLEATDLNAVRTGTLDSLAEVMIEDDRHPGEITPAVIENFMATGLLRREVMFAGGWYRNPDLETHLATFTPSFPGMRVFAEKLKVSHSFADRVLHDTVDLTAYAAAGTGYNCLRQVVQNYHAYLTRAQLMDFALLEQSVLARLQNCRLTAATDKLQALLVDEFQDTNYLQEQIYYELCRRSEAALTVVGDDDQSIYRFRGATVEIFSDFENRLQAALGPWWRPQRLDLSVNYRSTGRIVNFCNHFIAAEPDFQAARARSKRACSAQGPYGGLDFPVLGMFRQNADDLADALCALLGDIFGGTGRTINVANGQQLRITKGPGGDFGDAVLLAPSVVELTENTNGRPPTVRLPLLVRQRLHAKYGIQVFNPRGRPLSEIPEVARLLGLMLECIDPAGRIQNALTTLRQSADAMLNRWRAQARQFIASNPSPTGLAQFVSDWGTRSAAPGSKWPREWPLLELMFTLVTWFPDLQRTPEGQVYLEAVARAIAEAAQISTFESTLLFQGKQYDDQSVKEALREVFETIAEREVEVDEEVMPYVPRSHFPIMTIHQAKGLEFPLVIVDVGSAFRTNHASQRQSRYPDKGGAVHLTEDHCAPYSPVGPARTGRTQVQRAFDDLRRLFYVAKSRPHSVLLLVGLTTQLANPGATPHVLSVATGDLYVPPGGATGAQRAYQFAPANQWSSSSPDNFVALI